MEYQARVENGEPFKIEVDQKGFLAKNQRLDWDISPIEANRFSIIINNRSLNAELVSINKEEKKVKLKLDGVLSEIELKDKFDLLLDKMGLSAVDNNQLKDLKAPMPGLILDIKVETGAVVKKGDPLLVLEAMKMENAIKSPGDGVVKEIVVKKGQSVEKNQILIQF